MSDKHTFMYSSPVGNILLTAEGGALTGLDFLRDKTIETSETPTEVLQKAVNWLDAYFKGAPYKLDFKIEPKGTPYQKAVWQAALQVPFGETATYGEIAKAAAILKSENQCCADVVTGDNLLAAGNSDGGTLHPQWARRRRLCEKRRRRIK